MSCSDRRMRRFSRAPVAVALLLALGAAAAAPAVPAPSATPDAHVQRYQIAAGSLDQVLNAFASAAGVLLSTDAALTQARRSGGLLGDYTVPGGFERLLREHGLQAVPDAHGVYSLRPLPAGDATTLPAVKVESYLQPDVMTEGSGSYTAARVTAGSKAAQSLREIPRSVSVIGREQLNDQRITTFAEAMAQLPGVTTSFGGGDPHAAPGFHARGYAITNINVNGSPSTNIAASHGMEGMAKYDNIQLLRGPDGLLSGDGQPSAVVNLIRKRPLREFQLNTTVSAGRWSNYLGEIDLTGPLSSGGAVRGRAVVAYNDREYFFDGGDRQLATYFGTVAVDVAPQTVLTFGASLDRNEGRGLEYAAFQPRYVNGDPVPAPRSFGYGRWSFYDRENEEFFASLEHRFSDGWAATVNASRTDFSLRSHANTTTGAVDPVTGLGAKMKRGVFGEASGETTSVDAFIDGRFDALSRSHQLVIGINHQKIESYWAGYDGDPVWADVVDWARDNPDTLFPDDSTFTKPDVPYWSTPSETRQKALYATGKFELVSAVHLILGGRYSDYDFRSTYLSAWNGTGVSSKKEGGTHFTPYYGLVYDFAKHWSAYVTTVESYEDQSNFFTVDRKPLDPTTGRSVELGFKGEHLDGLLNSNLTLYRTERDKFAVRTSTDPDFQSAGQACCYSGDGEFVSQGVEIDVSGQLLPGLQVNLGYTYDDNETRYGANDGKRQASHTPKHMFRAWGRYQFARVLPALALGGGVQTQSDSFRNGTVNTWNPAGGESGTGAWDGPSVPYEFVAPGRAIWSAFGEYRVSPQWTAAVNVNNVFDKHYYARVGNTNEGNVYGEPRNLLVTLRGSFH